MEQIVSLGEVIERLFEFDREDTIYASEPWTEQSEAVVAREPDTGGLPREASDRGLKYFLEIIIAQEFVEDWLATLETHPTASAVCQRVIDYAINDA